MSYNLLKATQIITAGDMSATITSPVTEVELQDNIGFQLDWTGDPVGTFDVQVSIDYLQDAQGNVQNPGRWISVPLNPFIAATGISGDAYIDLNQMSTSYIRIVYNSVSGAGSLDAFITAKGV